MTALRAKRAAATPTLAETRAAYVTAPPATPLNETLDHFWELGQSLAGFPVQIKAPTTPLPVLKRLGQPAFLDEPLERLLGPAYRAISDQAMAAINEPGEEVRSGFGLPLSQLDPR